MGEGDICSPIAGAYKEGERKTRCNALDPGRPGRRKDFLGGKERGGKEENAHENRSEGDFISHW